MLGFHLLFLPRLYKWYCGMCYVLNLCFRNLWYEQETPWSFFAFYFPNQHYSGSAAAGFGA